MRRVLMNARYLNTISLKNISSKTIPLNTRWPSSAFITLLMGFLLISVPIKAKENRDNKKTSNLVTQTEVVTGLGVPWGMSFVGHNQLLISEREGRLKLINLDNKSVTAISGLPKIASFGQGGLLDVKTGPNYEQTGWIYITYSKPVENGAATTLARAKLAQSKVVNWEDLLITLSASSSGQHFGSRIAFDDKNHVFFSVGDRGDRDNGQDLMTHAATIIRLNLDGSIPADNPFVKNKNALDEIWSYGHRNPQGLVYDRQNSRLWSIEHGPRGGDEINMIEKSKNYGWPVISYGKEYWGPVSVGEGTHRQGMEQPIKYYVPSIAPSSLMLYQGNLFPQWKGALFSGALAKTHLNIISLDNQGKVQDEERMFSSQGLRIRNVITNAKGEIYYSTDDGKIFRLTAEKAK